jgi:alcohol dehydrogenase (cytochrome c)
MRRRKGIVIIVLAMIALGILGMGLSGWSPVTLAGRVLNTVRSANNPPGTLVLERRGGERARAVMVSDSGNASAEGKQPDVAGWSSYNRTLNSQRYSPLKQINTETVAALKVLCSYDTNQREMFETGPILVDGALIGTTAFDVFSIDAANCRENWRTHEEYKPSVPLLVNRGAAYVDGRLFRGTLDGRVLAYDARTGRRLWATAIGDPKFERVTAAPIVWDGLVFIGIAGGDAKGVKGRMYALSANNGEIVWETYLVPRAPEDSTRGPQGSMPPSAASTWGNGPDLPISGGATWTSYTLDPDTGRLYVPAANPSPDYVLHLREGANLYTNCVVVLDAKTGNYITHFSAAPRDWHDWDVSNTPAIIKTRGGKQVLSFAPKNGHLYGFDLQTSQLLYRTPVTRIENADVPLSMDESVHFCPGAAGGGEWNGVAFDPRTNLLLSGQAEWCTTVRLAPEAQTKATPTGKTWTGHLKSGPLDLFGTTDPHQNWAGWLYATDADSGEWTWRLKTNYPILGGVTATAGGIVLFGDVGGNFYAVDTRNGQRLWHQKLDGAIGGGVITYSAGGSQKVAVAAGLTSILWPTEQATGKIVILGLGDSPQ